MCPEVRLEPLWFYSKESRALRSQVSTAPSSPPVLQPDELQLGLYLGSKWLTFMRLRSLNLPLATVKRTLHGPCGAVSYGL